MQSMVVYSRRPIVSHACLDIECKRPLGSDLTTNDLSSCPFVIQEIQKVVGSMQMIIECNLRLLKSCERKYGCAVCPETVYPNFVGFPTMLMTSLAVIEAQEGSMEKARAWFGIPV